jgi:hypothetical protein
MQELARCIAAGLNQFVFRSATNECDFLEPIVKFNEFVNSAHDWVSARYCAVLPLVIDVGSNGSAGVC